MATRAQRLELQRLTTRIEAILVIIGDEKKHVKKYNTKDYFSIKEKIYSQLRHIDDLNIKIKSDITTERNIIRFKNTKRIIMTNVIENMSLLKKIYDSKKGVDSEIENDGKVYLPILINEIKAINENKPIPVLIDDLNIGMSKDHVSLTVKTNDLDKYTPSKVVTEELTEQHQQQLKVIGEKRKEQDKILDEIDSGISDLLEMSYKIKDELDLQGKMIDDLNEKTDKVEIKIDNSVNRVKNISKMTGKSSYMLYFICIALITIVGIIMYNIIRR